MSKSTAPIGVHLVGSIGIDTVAEVFSTVGRKLGRRVKRVPDGEPGGRRLGQPGNIRCCARTPT